MTTQPNKLVIEEIKGLQSFNAHSVYYDLVLALYIKGLCGEDCETLEQTTAKIMELDDEARKKLFVAGLLVMKIEKEEIIDLGCFARDVNGARYGAAQFANMTMPEIANVLAEVCLAISKIKVFF